MKIFISWSGDRSHQLTQALHEWLPLVLHYVKPWLSQVDISAGSRWPHEVAKELETTNFGIICVTQENLASPWILFEAGALAKSQGAKVIPLLLDVEISNITSPLSQYQAKKLGKEGLLEMVQSINQSADSPVPEDRAKQLFADLWPEAEKKIEAIPAQARGAKHSRSQHEILEELVATVRGFEERFARLDESLIDGGFRSRRRRLRPMHPMTIEDLTQMISEDGKDPIALLLFGSMLRDDLPWLYEVIVEVYHDLRSGDPKAARRDIERLRTMTKMLHRGPIMEEFASSKESHMMLMELPSMLDHLLHRFESRRRIALDDHPADSKGR
jgi:hypothetical protein